MRLVPDASQVGKSLAELKEDTRGYVVFSEPAGRENSRIDAGQKVLITGKLVLGPRIKSEIVAGTHYGWLESVKIKPVD